MQEIHDRKQAWGFLVQICGHCRFQFSHGGALRSMTVQPELDSGIVVLDRAKPDEAETSMLFRARPGWSEFLDVLLTCFNSDGYVFTDAPLNVL